MKLIFALLSVLIFSFAQVDSQPSASIVGGPNWEHPWYTIYKGVVNIINEEYTSCTGVLIHSEWVLTSAVCALKFNRQERRILYGGDPYVFDTASHIKNTFVHPEFNAEIRENDIALLELAKPADASIRIFKIPQINRSLVAKKGRVVKWTWYNNNWNESFPNTTVPDPNEGAEVLQNNKGAYAQQVVIINNELCANYPVHVSENRLCSFESIACEGDEGAPLISCAYEGNALVGLVSVSEVQAAICYYNNCMMPVTTYTSVVPYRSWIKDVTKVNML